MEHLGAAPAAGAFPGETLCGQEAAAKALGTGIRNGLAFNQFEVYNDELGSRSCDYGAKQSFWRNEWG